VPAPVKLLLASSNAAKLAEFRALAAAAGHASSIQIEPIPEFDALPAFDENAPTFAENALGKAIHYSRLVPGLVFADDSGLVVPALGGAPGVQSARYAGLLASNQERIEKLLSEMRGMQGAQRAAHFVCTIALAERGRAIALFSDCVHGRILEEPRGAGGFGYDPVFFYEPVGKTFAELPPDEKNRYSHRGRTFRKLLAFLAKRQLPR
jgi:XTP/dITP diphosphohydrolase